jgi:hypothetical protein
MGLFNQLSKFLGMFTTITAPQPAYVGFPPTASQGNQEILHYRPPVRTRRVEAANPKLKIMGFDEFRGLSLEYQDFLVEFVKFRYQSRISGGEYDFRGQSIEHVIKDMGEIETKCGREDYVLSSSLVRAIVL